MLLAGMIRALASQPCSTFASSRRRRRRRPHVSLIECGKRVAGPWRARVGYSGLSAHHREGDGTTPLGTYRIGPVVYGLDREPGRCTSVTTA